MSRTLINNYLKDLDILKTASGTVREGVVSEAFKDLLKAYARAHNLIFLNQYELPPQDGKRRYVDGALPYSHISSCAPARTLIRFLQRFGRKPMTQISLGRFGDRRLEKGGSFCMNSWCAPPVRGCACAGWARVVRERFV